MTRRSRSICRFRPDSERIRCGLSQSAPALLLALAAAVPAAGQEVPVPRPGGDGTAAQRVISDDLVGQLQTLTVPSPILTLDQEALFAGSAYGERLQEDLNRDRDALAAENRRIETELIAEEKDLTERRRSLQPEEFSPLARAFDEKVQRIRTEQDSKSLALQQKLEEARQTFLSRAGPILAELVRRRGAVAVIDRQALLLVFEEIDITDEAITLIDERLGTGSQDPDDATLAPRDGSSGFAVPSGETGDGGGAVPAAPRDDTTGPPAAAPPDRSGGFAVPSDRSGGQSGALPDAPPQD